MAGRGVGGDGRCQHAPPLPCARAPPLTTGAAHLEGSLDGLCLIDGPQRQPHAAQEAPLPPRQLLGTSCMPQAPWLQHLSSHAACHAVDCRDLVRMSGAHPGSSASPTPAPPPPPPGSAAASILAAPRQLLTRLLEVVLPRARRAGGLGGFERRHHFVKQVDGDGCAAVGQGAGGRLLVPPKHREGHLKASPRQEGVSAQRREGAGGGKEGGGGGGRGPGGGGGGGGGGRRGQAISGI